VGGGLDKMEIGVRFYKQYYMWHRPTAAGLHFFEHVVLSKVGGELDKVDGKNVLFFEAQTLSTDLQQQGCISLGVCCWPHSRVREQAG